MRDKFFELHLRKPHSKYFAGDDTGWRIAFALFDIAPAWETVDPARAFADWRAGRMTFRFFSIEVRPAWMAAELG